MYHLSVGALLLSLFFSSLLPSSSFPSLLSDLRAMAERLANRDENLLPFAFYDFLTWFKLQLPPEKLNRALEMLESIGKKYGVEGVCVRAITHWDPIVVTACCLDR